MKCKYHYIMFCSHDRPKLKTIRTIDRGILAERLSYGIGDGNMLYREYLDDKKKECTKKTLHGYINNLIEAGYIKRISLGRYVLNDKVAIGGTEELLFED